jgi:peroxiredoxin
MPVSAGDRAGQLGYDYDAYATPPKAGAAPQNLAMALTKPGLQPVVAKGTSDAKPAGASAPAWNLPDASGKNFSLAQYKGKPVVVIFYEGYGCIQCMKQLNAFATKARDFADAGIDLVAISTDVPEDLKNALEPFEKKGGFPFPLVSDAKLNVFKAYRCVDFDNQPLHGTFLIDADGRVRWRDIGDRPFNDPALVLTQGKQLSNLSTASR